MEIKQGDIVKLKSGGPRMTVSSPIYYENFSCTWFDKVGKLCVESFSKLIIVKLKK